MWHALVLQRGSFYVRGISMTFFCPDCDDYMDVTEEDNSFDHEFGVERIYDYYCVGCKSLLHTLRTRPRKEVEEP